MSDTPATREDLLNWHLLKFHEEKCRRTYYQTIVYEVCTIIDRNRGDGKKTVCGTVDAPTTEVQDTLRALLANHEPKF
jgi:hypothetical protein